MPPAAPKFWLRVMAFCSAMAPALSPADTMVLPTVLDEVIAGEAKPSRDGLALSAAVSEKPLACVLCALAPIPKIWVKLMPVPPRWVVSPVTFSA